MRVGECTAKAITVIAANGEGVVVLRGPGACLQWLLKSFSIPTIEWLMLQTSNQRVDKLLG